MMLRALKRLMRRRGQFSLGGIGGGTRLQPGCCCSCTCNVKFCVTGCPSGSELIGALVTVKSGGVVVGTPCETADDGSGHACCTICLPAGEGTYEVIVSATGYVTFDGNIALTCDETVPIALQPTTAPSTVCFKVTGCCGVGMPGATVTLSTGQSCTTDDTGACCFSIGQSGTITWTVSLPPRFANATGNFTLTACQSTTTNVTVPLTAASGYICGFNPYGWPVPTTAMDLTDSLWGAATLIWDAVNVWFRWTGPANSYPANASCPAGTLQITYTLKQSGGCVPDLSATYPYDFCGDCSAGFFTWNDCEVPDVTAATIPCADGSPTIGCAGNSPFACAGSSLYDFGAVTVADAEVFDGTVSFAGGTTGCTLSTVPGLVWTNFGPGTITMTEA